MKRTTIIVISAAVLVSVGAIFAFAHSPDWGSSNGWGYHMRGWHHQGYYGPRYDNQMSKEQYEKFEKQREAFFKETEELRTSLFNKQSELQNELDKNAPDVSKASELQKEISELQAQMDQKRIENIVEMRKIAPNAGRGFPGGGPMMGYGPMRDFGPMMGYGPRGGGYCW